MIINYVLAAFLIIFGLMGLFPSRLPDWLPYALALAAGVLILVLGWRDRRP